MRPAAACTPHRQYSSCPLPSSERRAPACAAGRLGAPARSPRLAPRPAGACAAVPQRASRSARRAQPQPTPRLPQPQLTPPSHLIPSPDLCLCLCSPLPHPHPPTCPQAAVDAAAARVADLDRRKDALAAKLESLQVCLGGGGGLRHGHTAVQQPPCSRAHSGPACATAVVDPTVTCCSRVCLNRCALLPRARAGVCGANAGSA